VSTSGGSQPRWRGDGRELFYLPAAASPTRNLSAVTVERAGEGLRFGQPTTLFDARGLAAVPPHIPFPYSYDISSDGKRFLVVRGAGETLESRFEAPLTVVINWDAALGR
jgi:hypothetical protein